MSEGPHKAGVSNSIYPRAAGGRVRIERGNGEIMSLQDDDQINSTSPYPLSRHIHQTSGVFVCNLV